MIEKQEIIKEVEPIVDKAVENIYTKGQNVKDAFNWAVEQIHDQHGEGYHALAILDVMYPKLEDHEKNLLAMRIPCGDSID